MLNFLSQLARKTHSILAVNSDFWHLMHKMICQRPFDLCQPLKNRSMGKSEIVCSGFMACMANKGTNFWVATLPSDNFQRKIVLYCDATVLLQGFRKRGPAIEKMLGCCSSRESARDSNLPIILYEWAFFRTAAAYLSCYCTSEVWEQPIQHSNFV